MPTTSLREDFVGDPPIQHSVELLKRNDGSYQVVARLYPRQGDWEAGSVPPPGVIMNDFPTRKEADLFYNGMLRQFERIGAP